MNLKKEMTSMRPISKLTTLSLFSSLGFAAAYAIWAIYLESFFHNPSYVGFLQSFFTIISVLSCFFIIPLLQKYRKAGLYLLGLLAYTVSYAIFAVFPNLYVIIIFGTGLMFFASLRLAAFGILVREKSKGKDVSKNEGMLYAFSNFAWMIGPIIAGFISSKYGFSKVFIFSSSVIFLASLLFIFFKIKDEKPKGKVSRNLFRIAVGFFKSRKLIFNYIISAGVTFWWTFIYVYVPIFIIESELSEIVVGFFLAGVTIPLIISEYSFGKLAGKIGFRKMFVVGYFIIAVFSLICFFIGNIYFVLAMLVIASFGMAMVESTSEAYFFDITSEKQREKYYGPYSTAVDAGNFVALSLSAIILLVLEFKFLFVFFGVSMIAFGVISIKIKNIIESRRK